MTVKPGWEIPMNRQYLEYIPEIGTPAANSHHGQQQPLHQQPGCKAANPSDHHDVEACSPWADHVSKTQEEITLFKTVGTALENLAAASFAFSYHRSEYEPVDRVLEWLTLDVEGWSEVLEHCICGFKLGAHTSVRHDEIQRFGLVLAIGLCQVGTRAFQMVLGRSTLGALLFHVAQCPTIESGGLLASMAVRPSCNAALKSARMLCC